MSEFHPPHASAAYQHIERLALRMADDMEVLDALSHNLIRNGHWVAIHGEAAEGDLAAILRWDCAPRRSPG